MFSKEYIEKFEFDSEMNLKQFIEWITDVSHQKIED